MNQAEKNDNYDRLWKMVTVSNQLNDDYAEFYNASEHLPVDEVTLLFKGRVTFKQYIPKKHNIMV
jgi:hypothetical protein